MLQSVQSNFDKNNNRHKIYQWANIPTPSSLFDPKLHNYNHAMLGLLHTAKVNNLTAQFRIHE